MVDFNVSLIKRSKRLRLINHYLTPIILLGIVVALHYARFPATYSRIRVDGHETASCISTVLPPTRSAP